MGKIFRRIIVAVAAGALSSCSIAPVKPGLPIQSAGTSMFRTYSQEGKPVSVTDVLAELRKTEASQVRGSRAETLYWASMVPASIGGYCLGTGIAGSRLSTEARNTNLGIGLGLLAIAFTGAYYSDLAAQDALEIYNSQAAKKKSTLRKPSPQISMIEGGMSLALKWSY
jgi:hypothetical protein